MRDDGGRVLIRFWLVACLILLAPALEEADHHRGSEKSPVAQGEDAVVKGGDGTLFSNVELDSLQKSLNPARRGQGCATCDQVPCGYCQEGCSPDSCTSEFDVDKHGKRDRNGCGLKNGVWNTGSVPPKCRPAPQTPTPQPTATPSRTPTASPVQPSGPSPAPTAAPPSPQPTTAAPASQPSSVAPTRSPTRTPTPPPAPPPTPGGCATCDQVPCGYCQEGCSPDSCTSEFNVDKHGKRDRNGCGLENGVWNTRSVPPKCRPAPQTPTPQPTATPSRTPTASQVPPPHHATSTPTTDAPTTDAPTTDAPTKDAPTTDAPITDAPTTDAPTTDAPSTDAPSTDAPSTDAPTTDAPTTDAPTTDAPTTDAPTTDAPTTDAPTTDAPTTDAPTTDAPTTDAPTTDAPTTNAPTTDAPTTDAPTTDAPNANAPTTDAPTSSSSHPTAEEPTGQSADCSAISPCECTGSYNLPKSTPNSIMRVVMLSPTGK